MHYRREPSRPPTDTAAYTTAAAAASKLVSTTQPSNSTGGVAFATQPKVTVEDTFGNPVTTDSSTVTLSITSGTPTSGGPGTLSGCSQTETSGVVTFSGCTINTTGTAYKLHATDASLTATDSTAFNITVGPATQLAFTQQPSSTATKNSAFATQPKVTVQDAGGNTVTTDTSSVTLSLNNPGSVTGATLSCTTNPVTASSGVATFAGCKINKAGTFSLTATDGSLTSATSN